MTFQLSSNALALIGQLGLISLGLGLVFAALALLHKEMNR